jgi:hypothetical protein
MRARRRAVVVAAVAGRRESTKSTKVHACVDRFDADGIGIGGP